MRMFRIFTSWRNVFGFGWLFCCSGFFKDVVNIGGEKQTVWLLLICNVIFTLFALPKFKSLEKCRVLH